MQGMGGLSHCQLTLYSGDKNARASSCWNIKWRRQMNRITRGVRIHLHIAGHWGAHVLWQNPAKTGSLTQQAPLCMLLRWDPSVKSSLTNRNGWNWSWLRGCFDIRLKPFCGSRDRKPGSLRFFTGRADILWLCTSTTWSAVSGADHKQFHRWTSWRWQSWARAVTRGLCSCVRLSIYHAVWNYFLDDKWSCGATTTLTDIQHPAASFTCHLWRYVICIKLHFKVDFGIRCSKECLFTGHTIWPLHIKATPDYSVDEVNGSPTPFVHNSRNIFFFFKSKSTVFSRL